jgi:hypothetical protein
VQPDAAPVEVSRAVAVQQESAAAEEIPADDSAAQQADVAAEEACECDRPACKEGSCQLDADSTCFFQELGNAADGSVCAPAASPCDADDVCSFGKCVVRDGCGSPGCSGMSFEAGSQVCSAGPEGKERVCCGSVCQSRQAMCKKAKSNGRRLFGWW